MSSIPSFKLATGYNTYNDTQYGNSVDFSKNNDFYLQMNEGKGENRTFTDGFKKNGIVALDGQDTITLSNKWHIAHDSSIPNDTGYRVSNTGVGGIEYDSADGGKLLISGPGGASQVKIEGSSGSDSGSPNKDKPVVKSENPRDAAGKISHNGQWEAITKGYGSEDSSPEGGHADSTLRLAEARDALTRNAATLSQETKDALKSVVDNWYAMGFTDSQAVTLQQMQEYGDNKPVT